MSRTYAVALIFAILTLFGGLFYGQYLYFMEREAEVSAYAVSVHERVIAGQLDELKEATKKVTEVLYEDTKERFRPIQGFIDEVGERRDTFLELSQAIKAEEENSLALQEKLVSLHLKHLIWLEEKTNAFLSEYGEQMDLNKRDIHAKFKQLETEMERYRISVKNLQHADMQTPLKRDLLTIDYLSITRYILLDIYQLTGGLVLVCFPPPDYHPVIDHGFSDPKLGETITTSISIGKLDYSLKPEYMFVLINGDTVHMNSYGMEPYSFTPTRRGKQVLEMELYVRNPLTGNVHREGVNHYNFHVR